MRGEPGARSGGASRKRHTAPRTIGASISVARGAGTYAAANVGAVLDAPLRPHSGGRQSDLRADWSARDQKFTGELTAKPVLASVGFRRRAWVFGPSRVV